MVDPIEDKLPPPRVRESRLLNVGFGVLNPLGESMSGKNFTPHNISSLDAVRKSTIDHFSEHLLQKSGHFIGIVLRVDGSIKGGAIDPSHWSSSTSLLVKRGDENSLPDLLQIRVRIPELHSHLPVPEWLPSPSENSKAANKAHEIINMYPSFVAASEGLTRRGAPDRGTLVWVDFQNRANYSGPTYYDKVSDRTELSTGEDETSASGADASLSERIAEGDYVPEYVDGTTTVELNTGYPISTGGYGPTGLRENRVRYYAYGDLKSTPGAQDNLVPLPDNMVTKKGLKVHQLLFDRLVALNDLWAEYYEAKGLGKVKVPAGAGSDVGKFYTNTLKVRSAYRKKEFSFAVGNPEVNDEYCPGLKKYCRKAREGTLRSKVGPRNCRASLGAIAFMSPHMTGLCVDFGNNGLSTSSSKKRGMRKTETWKFLVDYAWLFGLYPYASETWHFELQVPRENWFGGFDFIDPTGATYPVVEIHREKSTDILDKIESNGLIETYVLQGEKYDWLAPKEGETNRQFPYAVWVQESVDALGEPKVYTSSKNHFTVDYRVAVPGKEYFISSGLAINYLNPPTS